MALIELIKKDFKSESGVYYLDDDRYDFEDIYLKVRNAEGRTYSDSELLMLPDIDPRHTHYNEWLIRKNMCRRLLNYLNRKTGSKTILELGCGNGWLSNRLAGLWLSDVIGLDVNTAELRQAARVFSGKHNLLFACGNVFNLKLNFDYIILPGVIAYFNDLQKLIKTLTDRLNTGGELHILDSPFYSDTNAARIRSAEYYSKLGFPEMANHYHHHTIDDLEKFSFKILYNPRSLFNRIKRKVNRSRSPFHWVMIEKS